MELNLREIISLHEEWFGDNGTGERANLVGCDLSDALLGGFFYIRRY